MPSGDECDRQAVANEYGEICRQARLWTPPVAINPHLARKAELEAVIASWYVNAPGDQPDTIEGSLFRLERRLQSSLHFPRLS